MGLDAPAVVVGTDPGGQLDIASQAGQPNRHIHGGSAGVFAHPSGIIDDVDQ